MGRMKTVARRVGKGVIWSMAWAFVGVALGVGYGIDSEDARVLREFCDGVERWQEGPEFREVSYEYVRLSHAAMNATPWGVRTTTLIMGIRSVPGLPPAYAVSDTSQAHYDDFTRGELSAYRHLAGEQTMDWVLRDLHAIAQSGSTDADIVRFLRSWKMNRPVASDPAAVANMRRLLAEIDAAKPLESRVQIQSDLTTAARAVAARLGYPPEHDRQSREQQQDVFKRLDIDIRQSDPDLWRLKQVNDLCAGIWAQTFGRDYTMVITPVLASRRFGLFAGPGAAILLIAIIARRRNTRLKRCGEDIQAQI